jgi:hypothetical protein
MVTFLDGRMVNTHNGWVEAEASQANGPNPPPPPTLAHAIASILESCDEQTELMCQLVVAMGKEMLPLQLQPPTATLRPLIRRSSPRQESLLRRITGLVQSCPSFGSYVARRCRRLSSTRSNYMVGQLHRHSPHGLPGVVD